MVINSVKHWEVEFIEADTTLIEAETEEEAIQIAEARGLMVTGAKELTD
jgi:hypothetical protein